MPRPALACWICLLAGLAAAAVLALTNPARAAWPPDEKAGPVNYADQKNWPNDPSFGGNWQYWSFVPQQWQANVTAQNRKLGTGAHVDRAWAKTIGDRRVLISVIDSGANWNNGELVNKWHLNPGELPPPKDCPGADGMKHDLNGDGYLNVQDYTTIKGHEVPSFDKVCDKRLKDVNKNNILDPQDLIAAFTDGKDDDANGYVDDICGWDFFRNDNDAQDDTGYGHGDGEARDSSAEGNNNSGGIGTCPECSVQPLRAGDSFLADANDFGMAVLYAVDSGGSVVQEALGTDNNSALSKAAIDYAYANNVVVMASAADEDSYHHNYPATVNHTFVVHAVTHDSDSNETSTTFLNFNNCTNYGAQLAASVPGGACSSEAVGRSSGMAGLIYAAALQANIPAPESGHNGDPQKNRRLTAEEVMQIFIAGIDDLYDADDATDPSKYATRVGWEQRFGYGRVNARSSVDQVFAGRLPPEVEFRSPEWFEVIHPNKTPQIPIIGRVAFRNAPNNKFGDTVDFVLEWAPGIEPDDAAWKTITTGNMMAQGIDGPLAMWDVSGITIDNPTQGPPDNLVNRYMVTLRLRATVHSVDPKLDGTKGQARRAAYIYRDPDLLPGFPVHLGASGESSPKMYDLDGDGKKELILGDCAGLVHAFRADASEAPGWPVKLRLLDGVDPTRGRSHATQAAFTKGPKPLSPEQRSCVLSTSAIGDIDGDKKPEVFVADADGNLYAFHADGSLASGWPKELDRTIVAERGKRHHPAAIDDGVFAAPAMGDFDGDGVNEIVVGDMLGQLTIWKGDGSKMAGWPIRVWDTTIPDDGSNSGRQLNRIMSSPSLGDLDGDGTLDIVVATNEDYEDRGRVYAISGKTAQNLPGWPITINSKYVLPVVGSGVPNASALADVNGDKVPEVVIAGVGGAVQLFDSKGKTFGRAFPNSRSKYGPKSNVVDGVVFTVISNPAFGDVDDDGTLDVVYGLGTIDVLLAMAGGTRRDFQMAVGAWDTATAEFKEGFPQAIEDYQFFLTPLVLDVDGDGHSEVVNTSAGYFIHAFRADGTEAKGFPKFTGQWNAATPTVGDMDGDGKLEMAEPTRAGWLFVWHIGGTTKGRIDWDSFHHDARNTGNYDVALDHGTKAAPAKGCACAVGASSPSSGRGAAAAAGLAIVALLALRRRRMKPDRA
ncbi:MAG: hypothetical protein EXR72_02400 [Myxococcales bacterium]|nr:hypothetical protein [Myxococcales bacterium]